MSIYSNAGQIFNELDLLRKVDETFRVHDAAVVEAVQQHDLSVAKAPLLFLSGICEGQAIGHELTLVRRLKQVESEQTFVFVRKLAETVIRPLFCVDIEGCHPLDIEDEMPEILGPMALKRAIHTAGWNRENSERFAYLYFPL